MKRAHVEYKTIPTSQVIRIPPKRMAFILQATRYVKWQPTPVFWPGESHGQRSLAGYSPWGLKESDRTEQLTLLLYQWKYWKSPSYGRIVSSKPQIGTNLLQVVRKKKKKQIKYLNSRWSRKIWDVTKSGEGSRENAQPKRGQRWTIRNGRRSRGQRGMGSITWSMQHEVCAVGVSLGLVRQHWLLSTSLHCCEPKLRFPGVSHFTVLFGTKRRSPSENSPASILG